MAAPGRLPSTASVERPPRHVRAWSGLALLLSASVALAGCSTTQQGGSGDGSGSGTSDVAVYMKDLPASVESLAVKIAAVYASIETPDGPRFAALEVTQAADDLDLSEVTTLNDAVLVAHGTLPPGSRPSGDLVFVFETVDVTVQQAQKAAREATNAAEDLLNQGQDIAAEVVEGVVRLANDIVFVVKDAIPAPPPFWEDVITVIDLDLDQSLPRGPTGEVIGFVPVLGPVLSAVGEFSHAIQEAVDAAEDAAQGAIGTVDYLLRRLGPLLNDALDQARATLEQLPSVPPCVQTPVTECVL